MNLSNFKRIIVEDLPKESQELGNKLAYILNPTLEQLEQAFNKNIGIDNLNQQVKSIDVTVGGTGAPTNTTQFKSELKSQAKGIICIRAQNRTNGNLVPTSTPFISFSENEGLITITNISGLQASNKYDLTLLAIA